MHDDVGQARGHREKTRGWGLGFALRRRYAVAKGAWRETVTHYTPEPWLVALERDKTGLPIRSGRQPIANR